MRKNVVVRPARAADASQVAPLIFAAAPVFFSLLFGPQEADVLRFFERLFALPRNPFSFELALVAECDTIVVGVALAAPIDLRRRLGRRMAWLVPALRGPLAMLRRLPKALAAMRGFSRPEPGTFYLSILSVAAGMRGQGIGSLLLDEVEERALDERCAVTVLHVEAENVAAQRFYARHGFRESSRLPTGSRLARHGISGFIAMARVTTLPEL